MKPGLQYRPSQSYKIVAKEGCIEEWNLRERCVQQTANCGELGRQALYIKRGPTEFGVSPAGFWSCSGPVFPHYVPFPPFGMGMYTLGLWMLEVLNILFTLQSITVVSLP